MKGMYVENKFIELITIHTKPLNFIRKCLLLWGLDYHEKNSPICENGNRGNFFYSCCCPVLGTSSNGCS